MYSCHPSIQQITFYVPGTMLGIGDVVIRKTEKVTVLWGLQVLMLNLVMKHTE